MAAILDFHIEMILASFDLQVTLMLPTKFQVNLPIGSGGKAKDFQDDMTAILDLPSERF